MSDFDTRARAEAEEYTDGAHAEIGGKAGETVPVFYCVDIARAFEAGARWSREQTMDDVLEIRRLFLKTMRISALVSAVILLLLITFMISEAFARTPLHAPVYIAPPHVEPNKKPKRVIKRKRYKTQGRCINPKTKKWAKVACE